MRIRITHHLCLAASLLLLAVPGVRAQVDWSDLFPEEGSNKPVAKAPPPAARPQPQSAMESPKTKPKALPAKARRVTAHKVRHRAVATAPRRDSEFPETGEVAVPHFGDHKALRSSPPPSSVAEQRQQKSAEKQAVEQAKARAEAPVEKIAAPAPQAAAAAERRAAPAREQAVTRSAPEPKVAAAAPAVVKRVARAASVKPAAVEPAMAEDGDSQPAAVRPAIASEGTQRDSTDGDYWSALGVHIGDVITDKNVDKYTQVLSPGLEWAVRYGWRIKVGAPRHIQMLRAYREATEKYMGQVKLSPDGLRVINWTAGQPFPNIDLNDPQVALKIMWNYSYGFAATDDLDAENFDADTGSIGNHHGMTVERHYLIDNIRRLLYNGRLYVDPKPELPNPDDVRYKESLHPIREPFDLKGVGGTFYRYNEPNRQDDSWLYLPQLRRVRRLSTAQRSDALFGQDSDVDSYYGYSGQIAWMDWKFLGERTILAAMHGTHVPVKWQEPEDWAFDDVWEPRRVYVVEGTSKLPQYAYGKRVIFIDKEGWVVTHSDIYDRAGQLWKVWVNLYSYKKEAIPGARVSRYPEEMAFLHAISMLDTQLVHATKAALPSTHSRDDECIFINMGAKSGTTEEFFTVANLIEMGH